MNKYFKNKINKNKFIDKIYKKWDLIDGAKLKLNIGAVYSAINDINKALLIDENDGYIYYIKSLCMSYLGDFAQALDLINKSIELSNEFDIYYISALIERGNLYQRNNEYIKSILDYSEVLKIDSDNIEALYNRGYVYLINEKYEEAERDFEFIIHSKPYDSDTYNNLGLATYKLGKNLKAICYFHKSIELNPKSDAVYNLNIIQKELSKKKRCKNK